MHPISSCTFPNKSMGNRDNFGIVPYGGELVLYYFSLPAPNDLCLLFRLTLHHSSDSIVFCILTFFISTIFLRVRKVFPHYKTEVACVLVTVTIYNMVTCVGTFTFEKIGWGTLTATLYFLALRMDL